MYSAEILADSIANTVRITTIAVTFPRIILAEQNTHRMLSRNTASSRAIPVKTRCDYIEANPFVPEAFGKNQKGMQSDELLDPEANAKAEAIWREALADSLKHARRLAEVGVHKQYANRLTEPFSWVTQIVTATEWDNYFALRCHKDAQPEIQVAANLMREAMDKSKPVNLIEGQWHLPLVSEADHAAVAEYTGTNKVLDHAFTNVLVRLSSARCAAVSYEKHGVQKSVAEEIGRHDALKASGHMSPFEHQAVVGSWWSFHGGEFLGNFRRPWVQYRKNLPGENVFSAK